MLQIRLSKAGGGSAEGGSVGGGGGGGGGGVGVGVGGVGKAAVETVTVACPDHLVIADLPVAKALGAASSSSAVRSVGRRCRRQLGERVHFCVSCDFPIAVYGRLIPCEHAFCLTCARSDSSCYICDERIQKIQTIKMMEGIYICAAPHCLKSFLKRSDFESHIQETHVDLLQPIAEDGANEIENMQKPASTETHGKQLTQPESSTGRAPPRPGVSPSANSQAQDREDRPRRNQSREQTPMRPPPQLTPLPFHGRQQQQSSDSQPDSNPPPPQGVWYQHPQPQGFDGQSGSQHRRDPDQAMPDRPASVTQESPFRDYPPPHPFPLPNYQVPMIFNQGVNAPPFGFTPLPADRPQPIFQPPMEMPRPEMVGQQDQGSVLGFPPLPVGMPGFPENYPQWNNAVFANAQFVPQPVGIINPQGFVNPIDGQVRPPFMQGEYDRGPEGLPPNHHMPKEEVPAAPMGVNDGKGVMAPVLAPIPVPHHLPISLPPPPPLPRPSVFQQQIRSTFPGPD